MILALDINIQTYLLTYGHIQWETDTCQIFTYLLLFDEVT